MDRHIVCLQIPAFRIMLARAADHALRNRPVAVAPTHTPRAVIREISDEAFRAGIQPGMPVDLGRLICPDLRLIPPDPSLTQAAHRELQHRIANQLQLIIGALEIASRRASDANSRDAIEEVIRRAVSIARSHEQLSLTRIEREISLQAFFNRLIPTLSVPDRIRVVTSIEDATAAIGTAVRLGLIVNELVTNSVKHAFGEAGGRITISLEVDAERNTAMLRVADDGLGMGKMPRSGMGIGLIQTLSAQIGGGADWAAADGGGTKFTLSFRLDSVRP